MEKKEILFIGAVTLAFISASIETNICIPSLLSIMDFYQSTEKLTQLIIGANFLGLAVSSVLIGNIGDHFGKRKVLLLGMLIFILTSLLCPFAPSMEVLLAFRVLQGIAAACPVVLCSALIIERYDNIVATKVLSFLNGLITACLALAPIIGYSINEVYDWRHNFYFITLLASVALIGLWQYTETPKQERQGSFLSAKSFFLDMRALFSDYIYSIYTLIWATMCSVLIVYFGYMPFILITYENRDRFTLSEWQSSVMIVFLIICFLTPFLIKKIGICKTQAWGILFCCTSMIIIALSGYLSNFILMHASMMIFAVSNAMLIGLLVPIALQNINHLKGTGVAVMQGLRYLITAVIMSLPLSGKNPLHETTFLISSMLAIILVFQISVFKMRQLFPMKK